MGATAIHHLNYVVRDLDSAVERFGTLLGDSRFEFLEHAPRGSAIARTRVGDVWLVLVCPLDEDSVPGQFLARHGEGLFLLSFATGDLEAELARLTSAGESPDAVRSGVRDWRVADVGEFLGTAIQFTEAP